jgi:hypothetical protein
MPNDREAFEAHAAPMGFDLTRQDIAVPEPWAEYVDQQTGYFWAGWQAGAAAERERTITVADQSQDWKGMDGTTAFHLITRHADGWADVGKMMGEWLEANRDRSAP